ncbi:MFS transporter [Agromyces sp. SYSU T00194]|uniref:MFS transporter n=1 Tax=Agromyces chitinivorans TaxID=3158560 RepID=UPI00339A5985
MSRDIASGRMRRLRRRGRRPVGEARPREESLRPVIAPIAGLVIAQFVAGLSGTIVATALPSILTSLDGSPGESTWIVAATILGNTATASIWGRLADRIEAKRVVQAGLAFFLVGSLLAGIAPNTPVLIAARALQGIGLGGILTSTAATLAGLVAPRQRGRVNAFMATAQTTATLTGPVIGGIIVQTSWLGWRWCFLLSVPFAITSMIVIAATLKVARRPVEPRPADFAGMILLPTAITALLIAVSAAPDAASHPWLVGVSGCLGLIATVALVIVELRASDPVLPIRLFARRRTSTIFIAAFAAGSVMFSGSVFISQYLQFGLGLQPAISGTMLVPMAIATVVTGFAVGRFMSRTAKLRPVLLFGSIALVAGNAVLAGVNLAPVPFTIAGTVLLACGLGAMTQNLILASQVSGRQDQAGSMGATVLMLFVLGGTVGLVALGAVLTAVVGAFMADGASEADAYLHGMPVLFAVSAVAVVPAFGAVLAMPAIHLRSQVEEPDAARCEHGA